MSQLILNVITIALFLGAALYVIHLRRNAEQEAQHGLRLVRDGFLLAAVSVSFWLTPLGMLSPASLEVARVLGLVGIAVGLLVALRGMSRWHERSQKEDSQEVLHASQDAVAGFVESCIEWVYAHSETSDRSLLSQSFVRLIDEELNVRNSVLALCQTSVEGDSGSPVVLAKWGPGKCDSDEVELNEALSSALVKDLTGGRRCEIELWGKTFVCSRARVNLPDSASVILMSEFDSSFPGQQKMLEIGLPMFGVALERQATLCKVNKFELKSKVAATVGRAFRGAYLANFQQEQDMANLRIPRIIFQALAQALRGLGAEEILADYMLVETSSTETDMAVALEQSNLSSQPRLSFHPYSRRLTFCTEMQAETLAGEGGAVLLQELLENDSRLRRRKIADEGLQSIVYGSVRIDAQAKVMIALGSWNAEGFGESGREVLSLILAELQKLIGYVANSAPPEAYGHLLSERKSEAGDRVGNRDVVSRKAPIQFGKIHSSRAVLGALRENLNPTVKA